MVCNSEPQIKENQRIPKLSKYTRWR